MKTVPVKYHIIEPPYLLKGSPETNFIYKIEDLDFVDFTIEKLNSLSLKDRIRQIYNKNGKLTFLKCHSRIFENNLIMVDGRMPEILSKIQLLSFEIYDNDMITITKKLMVENPLNNNLINIYELKFKELLRLISLGMTPTKVWHGEPNLYDHLPILKTNGEAIAYIYNTPYFLETLFIFSQISSNKEVLNNIYEVDSQYYMNINLQINLKT